MSYDDSIQSSELDPPGKVRGSLAKEIILSVVAVLLVGAAGWACADGIARLLH